MRPSLGTRALLLAVGVFALACQDDPPVERGAVAIHVEGDVQVNRGQGFSPLSVSEDLEAAHVVKTGAGSMVLLHLTNGHLVKLAAGVEIAVGDIAQFDAVRTELALREQLQHQLAPEERSRLPDEEVLAERVAGFQHRRRAGRTVGAQPEAEPMAPSPAAAAPAAKPAPVEDEEDEEDEADEEAAPEPVQAYEGGAPTGGFAIKGDKGGVERSRKKARVTREKKAREERRSPATKLESDKLRAEGDALRGGSGGGLTLRELAPRETTKVAPPAPSKTRVAVKVQHQIGRHWKAITAPDWIRSGVGRCVEQRVDRLTVVVGAAAGDLVSVDGKLPAAQLACLRKAWKAAQPLKPVGRFRVSVRR